MPTPRLRPGLVLLRRSQDTLQLGLRRPEIVLADDGPTSRAFDDRGHLVLAAAGDLMGVLADRGVLLDRDAAPVLRPAVGGPAERREARDRAATVVRHGAGAADARGRRQRPVRVLVHGAAGRDLADEVDGLLRAAGGAGLEEASGTGSLHLSPAHPPVLVVADGEPPRGWSDDLVRADVPHLYLRVVESTVLLGPWVAPGITACLRCDDLHRASVDPAWPLLVQQATTGTVHARADDVPTPAEALAVTAAAAGAARDLLRDAEGLQPACWSTETRWGPASRFEAPATGEDDGEHGRRLLRRHAACGCAAWSLPPG